MLISRGGIPDTSVEQGVAGALRELVELHGVLIRGDDQAHHRASGIEERHRGLLGLLGQRGDPVDLVLDVGEDPVAVGAEQQLRADGAHALGGGRIDPLDAVDPTDGLLHREHDALLDLGGARPRVGHGDLHDVEGELGEDLLLDLHEPEGAAHEQYDHQQVGGDRVPRHPREGAGELLLGAVLIPRHRRPPRPGRWWCPRG